MKSAFVLIYSYYSENKEAFADYYDRGIAIPHTRNLGVIHHARLESMEGNVFTFIGSKMKGRRACWSIDGGNRLAALLCKHYSVSPAYKTKAVTDYINYTVPLSAAKTPQKDGKGYESIRNISVSSGMKWLKQISACKILADLSF